MFGEEYLDAKQTAKKLKVSYTYFFIKFKNKGCPYHQLDGTGRKYYVIEEVKAWAKKHS